MSLAFRKMHGLGNDFVIIDQRDGAASLTPEQVARFGHRRFGIGFDQLVHIKPPRSPGTGAFLEMYNADGSPLESCGNATRCVASLLMDETGLVTCALETVAGLLHCRRAGEGRITADMGPPRLEWNEIPLAAANDTLHLPLDGDPVAVSMGNPHCVFFVDDDAGLAPETRGAAIERNPLFPQRTNVEFARILSPEKIRMRVWERGTGVTLACGTGACATLVAAARRGLTGRRAELVLDGGNLFIDWRETDGHVLMTGPVSEVFTGEIEF